ncbi:MAG: ribonucleoside-triphosphate reductase, adenosylcobalamin-dependent [Synechococcales bacterium]|nr:ribonucleoside-triphosphate reductase, adenosylcobalamin-dependent [Synechococcales bacterium]
MNGQFPASAPVANPVFYRTYSRKLSDTRRESWAEVSQRTLQGLVELGKLTPAETAIVQKMQQELKCLPSGRWLWVGGTDWIARPENFSGAYNCTSTNVVDWEAFGLMMDLAMMGCGTGAILEPKYTNQLPAIRNRLTVQIIREIGAVPVGQRQDKTEIQVNAAANQVTIGVGDSRRGWVDSYQGLLQLSTDERFAGKVEVLVDLGNVRPAGEKLKGFGGVANPIKMPALYNRCAQILNKAIDRQLTPVECCLLIDEAAACVVAGNIRRSAGMRQGNSEDNQFAIAKDNLWQQGEDGNWRIDPERDALRMANHTRVFHRPPTKEETLDAVRKQFYSGEGAIQYAPEAIARSSADLLPNREAQLQFIAAYEAGQGGEFLRQLAPDMSDRELDHRLGRYGLNPCVTADTWVHTEMGPRQVKDLIGQQHGTYINGELFSTTVDGFFFSGVKPVVKLMTEEGYSLRLTGNHRLLKVVAQTQKAQYTEWVETQDLQPGDRVLIHNHRGLQPWSGVGTAAEGWLLGNLIGEGCFSVVKEYALGLVNTLAPNAPKPLMGCYHDRHHYDQVNSAPLAQLAKQFGILPGHKTITPAIEAASYDFYCGFLRGLFDADGSVQGTQVKGVSVRLSQSDEALLQAVQRMLLRLGINSTIYRNRRPEQVCLMPNAQRELAEYPCKAQHELVISNDNLRIFLETIGFQNPQKQETLTTLLGGYKRNLNRDHFAVTVAAMTSDGTEAVYDCTVPGIARFDANGFVAHNCGEILGENFHCNLSEIHLNQIDPQDLQAQEDAFTAGGLSVAALLNHVFSEERYRYSRNVDPIVGVSFTGLFDFFVQAFGTEWLQWWAVGRPDTVPGLAFKAKEQEYLSRWRDIVHRVVWDYCDRHGLHRPNRCTTVQPAGTKSLLTGASSGWHPPKAQRFIRRITFRKNDPVAMACLDYGYNIVPSQSDKDEAGNLLTDPFDPRCTEWLVEIPVEVPWASIPGADEIAIEQFSAAAQFDFYMQVQKYYTTHNTSATIELREDEIEELADKIYNAVANHDGYMSAALLARFDAPFPRLPFEKIDLATYQKLSAEVIQRRRMDDFYSALSRYDSGAEIAEGPAGCDSDKCMLPEKKG